MHWCLRLKTLWFDLLTAHGNNAQFTGRCASVATSVVDTFVCFGFLTVVFDVYVPEPMSCIISHEFPASVPVAVRWGQLQSNLKDSEWVQITLFHGGDFQWIADSSRDSRITWLVTTHSRWYVIPLFSLTCTESYLLDSKRHRGRLLLSIVEKQALHEVAD